MRRTSKLIAACVALGLWVPAQAWAQADEVALELVDNALDATRTRKYDEALTRLEEAQAVCRQEGCETSVKADIYLTQGIVYGLKGQLDEAQKRFEWALKENPNAVPDDRYTTRPVREAFDKAKQAAAQGSAATPPSPAGKLSDEQKEAIDTAKKQLADGDWEACLQTMIVSTSIEEYAAGKLMLAKCQDKGGLLIEARRDAEAGRKLAEADGDRALLGEIDAYLEALDGETPKIQLKIQSGIEDPVVKIDNTVVPPDKVKEPIPHNPGTAIVEVTGKRGGQPYEFKQEIRFQRRETIDLEVRSDVTPYQSCLNKARTLAEKEECDRIFNRPKEGLSVNALLEVSSYNDNDHVDVVTPSLSVAAVQPTDGWNVGGTVLVDVLTTASSDIVSTASPRFDDVRFAANLGGGYKLGPVTPSIHGAVSVESDYIGRTVGASVSADLADKMITPYVGYSFGFDILGRADTDFDVFSRDIYTHTITAGTSLIFDAETIGVVGATVAIEDGDTSKPYRFVPMFQPGVVDGLPRGADRDLVAAAREPESPPEQLPDHRQRYALLFRFAHRFETATLRADERLYIDSWGQMASTTDARFLWDFWSSEGEGGDEGFPQLRLTPHLRFHIQGPTQFWRRAYVVVPAIEASDYPIYRTGDRELGPLFAATAGAGLRAGLTPVISLGVQLEGIYTHFLDHLYIYDRWGLFTASTLELAFE